MAVCSNAGTANSIIGFCYQSCVCLYRKKRMHSNTHGTGAVSLSANVNAASNFHLQHTLDDCLCVA